MDRDQLTENKRLVEGTGDSGNGRGKPQKTNFKRVD